MDNLSIVLFKDHNIFKHFDFYVILFVKSVLRIDCDDKTFFYKSEPLIFTIIFQTSVFKNLFDLSLYMIKNNHQIYSFW